MGQRTRHRRSAVIGLVGVAGAIAALGLTGAFPAGAAAPAVGCGTGTPVVTIDIWARYGRQAPLVGDPNWGVTIETHVLANPLAAGQYRVAGVSEDNLSADGQQHEQWAVEIAGSRSGYTPDIPDDAVWYAATALPDDDGDLLTVPAAVVAQLPGFDLGLVTVAADATDLTLVHIEHDGQLAPWSPNSVNPRFVTLSCVPPATSTTVPGPTTTQAGSSTTEPASSTTDTSTTETATTGSSTTDTSATSSTSATSATSATTETSTTQASTTTTEASTTTTEASTTTTQATTSTTDISQTSATASDTVAAAGVAAAHAVADDPGAQAKANGVLAFTGTDIATVSAVGVVLIAVGTVLVRRHRASTR
jgi:hypothetical protein